MATINETGHAVNVSNFELLITSCTGYGASYNPSKASLQLSALNQLLADARTAMQGVIDAKTTQTFAIKARRDAFEGMQKLSTQLLNTLQATDANGVTITTAKGINAKIQGARVSKIADNSNAATVSTSQQSYTQIIEHFSRFISLLQNEPSYNPNEIHLKVATLQTKIDTMRQTNSDLMTTTVALDNARIARNNALYKDDLGIHSIAADIKKYLKGVFGVTSPEYKQISGISIKKLTK